MSNDTNGLNEFNMVVKWHAPGEPEVFKVIARDFGDAKEIARILFTRHRTAECVIDQIVCIPGAK